MTINENDFAFIRNILLNKPTIREYQIASRIAKSIKVPYDETVDNPFVKARLDKPNRFDTNIIIHYTHEKRLQSIKKATHQLWNQTFAQIPVINTRLIIGNRNNRNMKRELVHRHPQPERQITMNKH